MACWDCGKTIEVSDRYCRFCGQGQNECIPWYFTNWGIAVMTVLGLGPFSLYFVWKSPKLSTPGRWIGGILILAFTVFIIHQVLVDIRMVSQALAGM